MPAEQDKAAAVFLRAAVAFARDRLVRLLDGGAAGLLATIAPGADPGAAAAVTAGVDADLASARSHVAQVDPGAPVGEVVGHLAAAVGAVSDACRRIAAALPQAGTAEQAVAAAVRAGTEAAGGIAAQLGLLPSGPWSVSGTELACELRNDAAVDLAGVLTLTQTVLSVRFDWGAGRLTLVLAADAAVRLSEEPLVRALTGGAGVQADTHLVVTADSGNEHGLTVGGGTQRRTRLPASVSGAGVSLRDLTIDASRSVEITSVLAGSLGPVEVVVHGAGVRLVVDPAAATPISAASCDPAGAGVSVNSGLVRGGGYLAYSDGGYSGTLELTIGPVRAKALGLIGTRPGFSLVLLFFSEFGAPVQLSFGFTLDGVGGLLAVERTVSSDALMAGIHDGTADALLFPDDLGRVDRGLLEKVFPADGGTVAVGPAFKLGWGRPLSLLTAKLGVILVLPDPKVVLLGALRVAVPSAALPIIDLRASIYGEVTPERVLVLVSLAGSRLAGFGLSGDLGLLFGYGAEPRFAISAGGFHPGYRPPAELSSMRRLAVDISPPVLLSLRAEAYVALTSSAFMLGARVEVSIDFVVADAHGFLAFDAIVQWAPFHFELDIRAGISVRVLGETFAGVALALHLEGPGRWVAHGTATLQLLFLPDIDLEVGPLTWGTSADPPPAVESPLLLLREELARPESWQVLPPAGTEQLVTLRGGSANDGALFAHPLGGVGVRQRAVPLGSHIDHIGGHPVSEHLLALGEPTIGDGQRPATVDPVSELFASGLFLALTDDEKLSRPAFASYPCGLTAGGFGGTPYGPHRETEYRWETSYPNRPELAPNPELAPDPEGDVVGFDRSEVPHILSVSPVGRHLANGNPYGGNWERIGVSG